MGKTVFYILKKVKTVDESYDESYDESDEPTQHRYYYEESDTDPEEMDIETEEESDSVNEEELESEQEESDSVNEEESNSDQEEDIESEEEPVFKFKNVMFVYENLDEELKNKNKRTREYKLTSKKTYSTNITNHPVHRSWVHHRKYPIIKNKLRYVGDFGIYKGKIHHWVERENRRSSYRRNPVNY